MSEPTNSQEKTLNFSFSVEDPTLAAFTHLKLFNGYNEIVSEGYGNMNIQVSKGLYQLRIEMNEHVEDRNYRITADVTDSLIDIRSSSAMPARGLSSTHEYFHGPSATWSMESTSTGQQVSGSSVFIFLRYSDKERSFEDIADPEKGFVLLNENREVIHTLDKTNTKTDHGQAGEYFGSVAFHEQVPAGQYYVIYRKRGIRKEIPLYVFDNWQTQLFMMISDKPLFTSTRISIERQRFYWDNPQNLQLDALIQKMHNEIYFLPDELKQLAVSGKWDNPMLGIVACYMYLMTTETADDRLFHEMLHNLQHLILRNTTAPDLVALRLLGAIHFKQELPEEPLSAPCMILAGMNAFLKQSMSHEQLIKKGSIAEKAFKNMRGDSIWTTYDPLPARRSKEDLAATRAATKQINKRSLTAEKIVSRSRKAPSFKPEKDWITATIFSQLSEGTQTPDIATIAAQLQVTNNTVKSTLNKLNKEAKINAVADSVLSSGMSKKKMMATVEKVNSKINDLLGD